MPTVIRERRYRLYFYSNENREPPHIHVQYQSYLQNFGSNLYLCPEIWE